MSWAPWFVAWRGGIAVGRRMLDVPTNVLDYLSNGSIAMIVNTPKGKGARTDEGRIRASAVSHGVPCITTIAGAKAAVAAMERLRAGKLEVYSETPRRSPPRPGRRRESNWPRSGHCRPSLREGTLPSRSEGHETTRRIDDKDTHQASGRPCAGYRQCSVADSRIAPGSAPDGRTVPAARTYRFRRPPD
jgi:hypothetical protein